MGEKGEKQVALVTGGSRGIGRAILEELASKGLRVAFFHRQPGSGDDVLKRARGKGWDVRGYAVDIVSADSVKEGVGQVHKDFGALHVLVNNAGITRDGLIMRMKDEEWDHVINTNLRGVFFMMRAVAKIMVRQKYGRIVTISSIVGLQGNQGQANYAASKAGVIGLAKSVARELASRNITSNVVAPGFIKTDMTAGLSEEVQKQMARQIPQHRLGEAVDIAKAVAFLASEEAGYITGQVLNVDGGLVTA